MNIIVILNGVSKKKKKFYQSILPVLQQKFSIQVLETQYANHARQLASEAVLNKAAVILSAGGDGTLNQVLNGMMSVANECRLPSLGLIPLGSGNDFANSANLTLDPNDLLELLTKNQPLQTDIGKVFCRNGNKEEVVHYFINVCSVGMGPATVQRMEKSPPWMGAELKYLISIIQTFFTHKPEVIEVHTPDWNWKGNARVVAIANGRSFGNKIYIAPDASLEDGVFSTFIAGNVPLLKFLLYLQQLKGKKKITDDQISNSNTTKVEVRSGNSAMLETEGELIGFLPASIEVMPGQIGFFRK
ncbi:MAG: YegS/Rv2252/BmrU family lipid kinase [Cyclobacteriaceae bacterium]|nr:YegS/Rv2252/BmrU family lipid kinase [Cyclobacteriaceae bacterium]